MGILLVCGLSDWMMMQDLIIQLSRGEVFNLIGLFAAIILPTSELDLILVCKQHKHHTIC